MSDPRQSDASPPGTDPVEGPAEERPYDQDHPDRVGGGVEVLEDDVHAALEARIHELEARLRVVSAAYQQKQDEINSTKERLQRHAAVQEEIRRGEVVESLLEPVENLLRSLEAVKGQPAEAGLRMVHSQFMDALKRLGLEEVAGAGAPFDPNVHEAIATQPVSEKAKDNTVVSVFSTGYRFGNRLIRPARVVIGSYSGQSPEA